eukprot:CAMPEP_0173375110 /NCGR_PEP_ID=MMETSP1144-20121109/29454_1 /TAXON_ID=483371 /ORGANISM="non described non described, Strain CCMP2298" /LENGTH=161 /DNA_ID=CAMNT_0014327525 /DNA_START=172 /DNA_END=657 /DNA_ORIENTATION=-
MPRGVGHLPRPAQLVRLQQTLVYVAIGPGKNTPAVFFIPDEFSTVVGAVGEIHAALGVDVVFQPVSGVFGAVGEHVGALAVTSVVVPLPTVHIPVSAIVAALPLRQILEKLPVVHVAIAEHVPPPTAVPLAVVAGAIGVGAGAPTVSGISVKLSFVFFPRG